MNWQRGVQQACGSVNLFAMWNSNVSGRVVLKLLANMEFELASMMVVLIFEFGRGARAKGNSQKLSVRMRGLGHWWLCSFFCVFLRAKSLGFQY